MSRFLVNPVLYPCLRPRRFLLLVLSSVLFCIGFGTWFHSVSLLLGLVTIQSWRGVRRERSSTFLDHRYPNLLIHLSYRCIATRGVHFICYHPLRLTPTSPQENATVQFNRFSKQTFLCVKCRTLLANKRSATKR